MRQALIRCLCRSYRLPDLQIVLEKDREVTLTEEQARSSLDLAHARSVGAVSVRYVTVCQVQRVLPDDSLNLPKTPRLQSPPPLKPEPTPAPVESPPGMVTETPVAPQARAQKKRAREKAE